MKSVLFQLNDPLGESEKKSQSSLTLGMYITIKEIIFYSTNGYKMQIT
jgi:hypothetical protein